MKYAVFAFALCLAGLYGLVQIKNWRTTPEQRQAEQAAVNAQRQAAAQAQSSRAVASRISQAELQQIIAEVYHVETSRFIQPDLLWITLPAGAEAQKTCQGIANLWAVRSGLDYVRVESWSGNKRLGQGTVHYGRVQTP